jgi:hypothetical protein
VLVDEACDLADRIGVVTQHQVPTTVYRDDLRIRDAMRRLDRAGVRRTGVVARVHDEGRDLDL